MRNGDPRRRANRDAVVNLLRVHGALSRAELVRATSLSRPTISSIVAELQQAGLVDEAPDAAENAGGRPAARVRLNRDAGAALGIDFGKRHLHVAIADLGHQVLADRRVELPSGHDAATGIERAAALVEEMLAQVALDRDQLRGAAMGIPGPVTGTKGELGSSTILPGWVGVQAADAMSTQLGIDVIAENDANLGALAEWTQGAGRGCDTLAYVKVSSGIGAGLIIDGHPFRGADGTAGELGHVLVDPDGRICRCGNRGCLETVVGSQALLDVLRPALGEISVAEMLERAREGDLGCRRVIADAGTSIGTVLAALCNLVNPERIVVGGDLAAAGDLLLDPARAALERAAIGSAARTEIVRGVLGDHAEVLGAVALALRQSGLGVLSHVAAV